MGLLSDETLRSLAGGGQNPPAPSPGLGGATTSPATQNLPPVSTDLSQAAPLTPTEVPSISSEEQNARFGGEVGSAQYYKSKLGTTPETAAAINATTTTAPGSTPAAMSSTPELARGFASAVGIDLPPEEEFDKMPRSQQTGVVLGAGLAALTKGVLALPGQILKIPIAVGKTAYQGWERATGKTQAVAEETPLDVPILGQVPSYFKTYDDARKSGMGPLAAGVTTFGRVATDGLILYSAAGALKSAFQPRAQLAEGEAVQNTAPISSTLAESQGKLRARLGSDSPSEYYTMPKSKAAEYGGHPGNTFVKFTPATSDGSQVEISIVQTKGGLINSIKNKLGKSDDLSVGKFGPEKKIYSEIVPAGNAPSEAPPFGETPEPVASKGPIQIPSAPMKGFEDTPVTPGQIGTLKQIGEVNGIDPSLSDGVVKALTGKDVVGDLNQKEFVDVAQTLSKIEKSAQYAPDSVGFGNWIKNFVSPTRYWTRDVQTATGIPVYDAHMQLETGVRLAKVAEATQRGNLYSDPIIEKYADSKYAEERRLVKAYSEGHKDAILKNDSLSDQTKTELVHAADVFDKHLKNIAQDIGMEPAAFIDNYAPHISDRGGVFQMYKEQGEIPGSNNPFFKEKRTGSLSAQVDDMWALADIYTRAAYKAKFYGPALDSMNAFKDQLPGPIRDRLASYVQEKLGYAGTFEKVLDSIASSMNKKFGWDLPPDTARVVTNQALNTMYSSSMSQPATWVRNAFQYPTMGYAYWGPRFMGEAMKTGWSAAGMEEFLKSGFSVDLGTPFGQELAKEATPGGKLNNAYRDATQKLLTPNAFIENRNRAAMYFQSKFIFDDAVSRYNSGKLNWAQTEKALGLDSMSPLDANLIRQDLIKGDLEGARNKLTQNAIDDTQFPYRRGESWRLGYGMAGHISTPFMQWPVEYFHTLGKWAGTGQFAKLVRWYASSALIARTMKDSFGFDFGKSLGFSPITNVNTSPPPLTFVQNSLGLLYNHINDNEQAYQKNADELFRLAKLTVPGGVEGSNLIDAEKAYREGTSPGYTGPQGTFPIRKQDGSLNYYGSFKDVFWNAMGFPTLDKVNNSDLAGDMSKDSFAFSQAKKQVLGLYQDGLSAISAGDAKSGQKSLDQANAIIEEAAKQGLDLTPSDADFNKYYIPANQRTYNALPASLKAKYAPRVFPAPTTK